MGGERTGPLEGPSRCIGTFRMHDVKEASARACAAKMKKPDPAAELYNPSVCSFRLASTVERGEKPFACRWRGRGEPDPCSQRKRSCNGRQIKGQARPPNAQMCTGNPERISLSQHQSFRLYLGPSRLGLQLAPEHSIDRPQHRELHVFKRRIVPLVHVRCCGGREGPEQSNEEKNSRSHGCIVEVSRRL